MSIFAKLINFLLYVGKKNQATLSLIVIFSDCRQVNRF